MFLRMFLRTFLNTLFVDNFVINFFIKLCNKNRDMFKNNLKKNSILPLQDRERRNIFHSFTGDTLDCNN